MGIASNLQSTVRDLQRRKARGRRGLALMEGVRLVEDALAAACGSRSRGRARPRADGARTALVAELGRYAVPVEQARPPVFASLAAPRTPAGDHRGGRAAGVTLADIAWSGGGAALVIDAVQDPGNVGTLIAPRTLWAPRERSRCAARPIR